MGGMILYAYIHGPWTQTIGQRGPGAGSRSGLERVNGGNRRTYVILSTIKNYIYILLL